MSVQTISTTPCPDWCTDHTGFDDGSDDWHKGSTQTVGKYAFYVTTGNLDGIPEVFFEDSIDALSLDEAERMARTLLAAVEAGRRDVDHPDIAR